MTVTFSAEVGCNKCGRVARYWLGTSEFQVTVERDAKAGDRIPIRYGTAPGSGWTCADKYHHCDLCTSIHGPPIAALYMAGVR